MTSSRPWGQSLWCGQRPHLILSVKSSKWGPPRARPGSLWQALLPFLEFKGGSLEEDWK